MIYLPKEELAEAVKGFRTLKLNTASLPILRHVLVQSSDEGVSLNATNLDEALSCRVAATGTGRFLVPFDALQGALKSADKSSSIHLDERSVQYRVGGSQMSTDFATLDVGDYPPLTINPTIKTRLPASAVNAIKEAMTASSDDPGRYILHSVHVDRQHVVATDGRQVYCKNSLELPLPEDGINLPKSSLLKLLDSETDAELSLAGEGNDLRNATLQQGKWTVTLRLVDGKFPNWKQVLPEQNSSDTVVAISDADAEKCLRILPSLAGLNDDKAPVIFGMKDGRPFLCPVSNGHKPVIVLETSTATGNNNLVVFNREFLLIAIRNGFRTIRLKNASAPIVCTDDVQHKLHVFMPLRSDEVSDETLAKIKLSPAKTIEAPVEKTPPVEIKATSAPMVVEVVPAVTPRVTPSAPAVSHATVAQGTTETAEGVERDPVLEAYTVIDTVKDLVRQINGHLASLNTTVRVLCREKAGIEREHRALVKTLKGLQGLKV